MLDKSKYIIQIVAYLAYLFSVLYILKIFYNKMFNKNTSYLKAQKFYKLTEADKRMVAVKLQRICITEDYTLKVYCKSAKTSDYKCAYTAKNAAPWTLPNFNYFTK